MVWSTIVLGCSEVGLATLTFGKRKISEPTIILFTTEKQSRVCLLLVSKSDDPFVIQCVR